MQPVKFQHAPTMDEAALIAALPRAKSYKLFPGCAGVYLLVQPNGGKYWRYRVRRNGINTTLSLGKFPDTSLAAAVTERDRIHAQARMGLHPVAVRRAERKAASPSKAPAFAVSLSAAGELTVIAGGQSLHLSPRQTEAVRAALIAGAE